MQNKILYAVGLVLVLISQPLMASDRSANMLSPSWHAIAGDINVENFESLHIIANGYRYEPYQSSLPDDQPLKVSDYTLDARFENYGDRLHLERNRDTHLIFSSYQYTEIINGEHGLLSGVDNVVGADRSGPLPAHRLVSVKKQQKYLNPHLLIASVISRHRTVKFSGFSWINHRPQKVFMVENQPRKLKLHVDFWNKTLTRLETVENDFLIGDAELLIDYSGWVNINGNGQAPAKVEAYLDGVLIIEETKSSVSVNESFDPSLFTIPEDQIIPLDMTLAEQGNISSQWFGRVYGIGAPIPFIQPPVQTVEISPDVILLTGVSHNSLAVRQSDGVVVIEPPLFEALSLSTIDAVEHHWPGVPISHIVVTHHHFDHMGGVRAYAALGATIVVSDKIRDFTEQVLEDDRRILPDSLSNSPLDDFTIKTVGADGLLLNDDAAAVQILPVDNIHSDDMVFVYLPDTNTIFVADLLNPDGPQIPPFDQWERDFRNSVEQMGLEVDWVLGSHGATFATPW